jgi:mono/diheme cytochrome c family protein
MRNVTAIVILCLGIPVSAGAQSVSHGKYIVERASMCNDCHTPRDDKGQLIVSQTLQGAPIGSAPLHPMPWAAVAPPIAGVPANFSTEQMVTFLQTGKRPDGSFPRPPMPPYRFSHADAAAITAYLRTLKP